MSETSEFSTWPTTYESDTSVYAPFCSNVNEIKGRLEAMLQTMFKEEISQTNIVNRDRLLVIVEKLIELRGNQCDSALADGNKCQEVCFDAEFRGSVLKEMCPRAQRCLGFFRGNQCSKFFTCFHEALHEENSKRSLMGAIQLIIFNLSAKHPYHRTVIELGHNERVVQQKRLLLI